MSGMSGFGGSASVLAAVGNSSVNLAAAGEIATPRVPDKKFKVGGLSATIWRGVSEKGMAYFSVQLSKSYKDKDILVTELYELRKHKGLSRQQAKKLLEDYNYFGCMLLHVGKVDAFCSSCVCSTAELMRPSLQVIKTREGISTASEIMVFIDRKKDRVSLPLTEAL